MQYLELTVAVRPRAVEAAAGLLRRYVPAGVSIEPAFEALDDDAAVVIDEAGPVRLRAWLPGDADGGRAALAPLRGELRALGDDLVRPLRVRSVQDASWANAWKRHFPLLRIGRRLVVRPSWRRYRPRPGDVVIHLDPGMAFGTGHHATTRLCLEALEDRLVPEATVLDVGAGSGILSLAAGLLGAARADAVDIDPAAVLAAKENAARNGLLDILRVARGSLGEAWPFPEPPQGRYDSVFANLNSGLIQELARPLVNALRPEGVALLSGVSGDQEDICRDALTAAGGRIVECRADGAWRLLVATTGRRRRARR